MDPCTYAPLVCKLSGARSGPSGPWRIACGKPAVRCGLALRGRSSAWRWPGHGGGARRLRAPEGSAAGRHAAGRREDASHDSAVDHPVADLRHRQRVRSGSRSRRSTVIEVSPGQPDLQRIGKWIADLVAPALEATLDRPREHGHAGVWRHQARGRQRHGRRAMKATAHRLAHGHPHRRGHAGGRVLRRADAAAAAAVVDRVPRPTALRRLRARPRTSATRRASGGAARSSTSRGTSSASTT